MRATIPDKLYFKIGEVAKLADVAPHVLRYWESEFKEINPKRANSGQRLYRRKDVETILLIEELLHTKGYTISGARKFLAEGQKPAIEPVSADIPTNHMGEIKEELLAVKKILSKSGQ